MRIRANFNTAAAIGSYGTPVSKTGFGINFPARHPFNGFPIPEGDGFRRTGIRTLFTAFTKVNH